MYKVSELAGLRVLLPKKPKVAKDGAVTERVQRLGKVHNAVFTPDGLRVTGVMVKRPDVVGMVKREDAFVALDSLKLEDGCLVVTRPDDGMDEPARRRLGLNWDACIIWSGMDARTTDGKPLGYVSDAEFDPRTGAVFRFSTTDGSVARALLGSFVITPDMVLGYRDGYMVVNAREHPVELDGGLAGAAGEGYARAKAKGGEIGKKVGAAAGEAVDKGSFALGKMIGKAQRAIKDASQDDDATPQPPESLAVPAADVRVSKPVEALPTEASAPAERPAPKTYRPAAEGETAAQAAPKAAAQAQPKPRPKPRPKPQPKPQPKKSASDQVARAAGKQLGSLGKMFGSFRDEFNKANK